MTLIVRWRETECDLNSHLVGGQALKSGQAMGLVSGSLTGLSGLFQSGQASTLDSQEPIPNKAIMSFHAAVAPRFTGGIEDRLYV